jgi:hypothetical protein
VRDLAADQRPAVRSEAAGERRLDVLVGQIVRRQPAGSGNEPPGEAGPDDAAEPDPDGDGGKAGKRIRTAMVLAGCSDVDGHETAIGSRLLSLERGMPG